MTPPLRSFRPPLRRRVTRVKEENSSTYLTHEAHPRLQGYAMKDDWADETIKKERRTTTIML
jgi:hypothetical protein